MGEVGHGYQNWNMRKKEACELCDRGRESSKLGALSYSGEQMKVQCHFNRCDVDRSFPLMKI